MNRATGVATTTASDDGDARLPADFERTYAAERPALLRLAALLVRSDHVAEELVQEAFLRLLGAFDEVDNPAGFLRTVTVRLASTWRSRHAMEQQRLTLVAPVQRLEHDLAEPDETWEALGRLRPERATVLVLRFYQDLSQVEIARILGCPTATVRSRVRRGLADLRQELER